MTAGEIAASFMLLAQLTETYLVEIFLPLQMHTGYCLHPNHLVRTRWRRRTAAEGSRCALLGAPCERFLSHLHAAALTLHVGPTSIRSSLTCFFSCSFLTYYCRGWRLRRVHV